MRFKVITSTDQNEFSVLLLEFSKEFKIIDIKYATTSLLTAGNSSGVLYTALVSYKE